MTSGDFKELTCTHPTLGARSFFFKSGEDATLHTGGYVSADDDALVDTGGNMIDQMNINRWSFSGTLSNDMNVRKDHTFLQQVQSHPVEADWTISHINGIVYGGKGKPVGGIVANTQAGTIALKLAGGGQMTEQS